MTGVLLVLPVACLSNSSKQEKLHCKAVLVENGYGYLIGCGHDTVVYQPYIPAIGRKLPFTTEEDALRVGEWVCQQITKKESPSVSKKELVLLGIKVE